MSAQALEGRLVEHCLLELPVRAVPILEACDRQQLAALLSDQSPTAVARALQHISADLGAETLPLLEDGLIAASVPLLGPVRAAGLLTRLDTRTRERVLSLLPGGVARDLGAVLEFPPQTAGRLMDAKVGTFLESMTVAQTLERIRRHSERRITDVVIVSPEDDFIGVVSLQALVGATPEQTLSALVRRDAPHVLPMATNDEVVDAMNAHKLASLPVVGMDGKVLGIIRYDALVKAAQSAIGQDMQQMVGAGAEERALSSPWFSVKSRLPWLQINLLTAFIASAVVSLFDATIAQFTALAVLMPVVAGQSGNTGAQSLAVTARGLALREIRVSHVWRVLTKELIAALINGTAVAIVTSIGVLIWSRNPALAFVIGTSMVMSMVMAALAGGAIPIILTALKRDPATASSIVLTTVTDICGFFSFLGLASLLSRWLAGG